jgi:UPF0755 protein
VALTRRGRLVVALSILLAAVAVPVVGVNIYLRSIGLWGDSHPGRRVEVVIPKGATANEIGEILERAGVVKSAFGFRLATFLEEGAEDVQAGKYQIPVGLTARDALKELLRTGPAGEKFVNVTVPEGSWLVDFAARLERDTHLSGKAFLQLARSGEVRSRYQPDDVDMLEGLLFPSTYQVVDKDDERSVLSRMVEEFEKQVSSLDLSAANSVGLSPYEIVIVASMIEAETFEDSERAKVARVIYNRLADGIPLGIDATILYALGEHKEELTATDLAIDSPYNTREVAGLPPTPIGAPGLESLEAALHPADGEWLYYVLADCDGHHAFSASYDDFLANKAKYQSLEC